MRPVGTCPQAGAAPWEACSTDIDSIHGPVRCRGRCDCTGCVVSIDIITNRNKQCGVLHCHCCWRRQKDGWMQQRRPIRCLQCCNGICGRTVRDRPLHFEYVVCWTTRVFETSQSHGKKKAHIPRTQNSIGTKPTQDYLDPPTRTLVAMWWVVAREGRAPCRHEIQLDRILLAPRIETKRGFA